MTDDQRELIAMILEEVAENGLPGPRDLDVALDAIDCAFDRTETVASEDISKPPVRTSLKVERDPLGRRTVFRSAVFERDGKFFERYGFALKDGERRDETDPVETVVYFRWMADRIEQHFNPEQRLASRNRYEIERRKWEGR